MSVSNFNGSAGAAFLIVAFIAGCAQQPEQIAPTEVSDAPYRGLKCAQLIEMRQETDAAVQQVGTNQKAAATSDEWGILLFGLPVGSMSGGNQAPTFAYLKGKRAAIDRAMAAAKCS